jgi:hypothetical protein
VVYQIADSVPKGSYFVFFDTVVSSTFVSARTSLVLVFPLCGNIYYVCIVAFMCFSCRLGSKVFTVPCCMGNIATEPLSRKHSLLMLVA